MKCLKIYLKVYFTLLRILDYKQHGILSILFREFERSDRVCRKTNSQQSEEKFKRKSSF
jgi:hypothetical protein